MNDFSPPRSSGRAIAFGRRRVALSAALAVFFLLSAACHKPAARLAYDSIDGATTLVQASLRAFNVLYQQGLATEADRLKAKGYYETFQKVAIGASYVAEAATTPEERAAAIKQTGDAAVAAARQIDDLSAAAKARAPAGGAR